MTDKKQDQDHAQSSIEGQRHEDADITPGVKNDASDQESGNSGGEADPRQAAKIPQGGLNPELGDMDAESDPDHEPDDDNGLPGKAGGGLMGA